MKLRWELLGAGAACAACCAPLIASPLAGLGLLGGGAVGAGEWLALPAEHVICLAAAAGIIAGLALLAWGLIRRPGKVADCACRTRCDACGAATDR